MPKTLYGVYSHFFMIHSFSTLYIMVMITKLLVIVKAVMKKNVVLYMHFYVVMFDEKIT